MMESKVLSKTDQSALEQLFEGKHRHYPAGQILIFKDDIVGSLALIKSGYVMAYTIHDDGSQAITFILTPGMVYPVFTLLALRHVPTRYFYEALTDIDVDITNLDDAKERMNDEKINILADLTYIGQSLLADTVDVLSSPSAEDKVRKLLFSLSKWLDGDEEAIAHFKCRLTQQNIGDMAGLSRETASMIISKLKEEKSIWYKDQLLVVDKTKILGKAEL